MRLKFITGTLFAFLIISHLADAQVLHQFTWDATTDERIADVGPNGTSSGSMAAAQATGNASPQGCAPGIVPQSGFSCFGGCAQAINLIVPTVAGDNSGELSWSIDYRHNFNETECWFFQRGSFSFGLKWEKCEVNFRYNNGSIQTANFTVFPPAPYSGGTVPNDNVWRNYQFTYDQSAGIASIIINGGWYQQDFATTPGAPLEWSGDPASFAIGSNCDAEKNDYSIFDNAIIQQPIPLPVTLSYFDAQVENRQVLLSWETTTESDNHFFQIERSADGENFEAIGKVIGSGTTSLAQTYDFRDPSPLIGKSFYRLLQVDRNGNMHHHVPVEVDMRAEKNGVVALYPNPVSENQDVIMKYDAMSSGPVYVKVYDVSGRMMFENVILVDAGVNEIKLNVGELPKGMYIVKAVQNGSTFVDRFTKLQD